MHPVSKSWLRHCIAIQEVQSVLLLLLLLLLLPLLLLLLLLLPLLLLPLLLGDIQLNTFHYQLTHWSMYRFICLLLSRAEQRRVTSQHGIRDGSAAVRGTGLAIPRKLLTVKDNCLNTLTLVLLVANLVNTKWCKISSKYDWRTLGTIGYSSEMFNSLNPFWLNVNALVLYIS